jgi:ankyrin repeat protein
MTALFAAAIHGRLDLMEALIEKDADVNARAINRTTPLIAAVVRGHTAAVERLIAAGADVNAATQNGVTALIAAANGCPAAGPLLLRAGADPNSAEENHFTALVFATAAGNADLVKTLLDAGAQPTPEARQISAESENQEIARLLTSGTAGSA